MAYCVVSDVQALMGQTFNATSRPTVAEVMAAIDETAAEIDGVLAAAGYTVPVSGTASVLTCKRINTYGAAVNAWHTGVIADEEPARVVFWREAYANFISRIRRGEQSLPDESPTAAPNTGFGVAMKRSDGYATYNPDGAGDYTTGYFNNTVC